jgi:hypothetical protein
MVERAIGGAVGNRQVMGVILNAYPTTAKYWFYYHTQAISVKKSGVSALLNLGFLERTIGDCLTKCKKKNRFRKSFFILFYLNKNK